MDAPPSHLDGARVLKYAISRRGAFYHAGGEAQMSVPISAMAICCYDGENAIYVFKCSTDWEVIHDDLWDSVDEAMQIAAQMAVNEAPEWITVYSN